MAHDLKQIIKLQTKMDDKLNSIQKTLNSHTKKLDSHTKKLSEQGKKITMIWEHTGYLTEEVGVIRSTLDSHKQVARRVQRIEEQFGIVPPL